MGWCLLREGADASAFEILLEATHREDADDGSRHVVDLVGRYVLVTASTETEQGRFHYRASADHKVALDWPGLKFIRGYLAAGCPPAQATPIFVMLLMIAGRRPLV